jgi:Fe-S-cluster containining protein
VKIADAKSLRAAVDQVPQALLDQLDAIFAGMDKAYTKAAAACGFKCRGCQESCCRTRFYHHTVLELAYLKQGLAALTATEREAALDAASRQIAVIRRYEVVGEPPRAMCPLNVAGRCRLYAQRPMICRLHGIAHLLQRGDGTYQTGPGCHLYSLQCPEPGAARLDRTPHYRELAALEQLLRRTVNFQGRIKLTVAEMMLVLADGFWKR